MTRSDQCQKRCDSPLLEDELPPSACSPVKRYKWEVSKLVTEQELPEYRQTGFHITGRVFRPTTKSTAYCFKSWFFIHYDFLNIWSHVIPGFAFFLVTLKLVLEETKTVVTGHTPSTLELSMQAMNITAQGRLLDAILYPMYTGSATLTLGCSALYHTYACHSQNMYRCTLALDFAGIVVLTLGSYLPVLYYTYYCMPHIQLIAICIIAGYGTFMLILTQTPFFQNPANRTWHAILFTIYGMLSVIAFTHLFWHYGWVTMTKHFHILYIFYGGFAYIAGVILYIFRFPEKYKERTFDVIGHSHFLFHSFVVLAVGLMFIGITRMRNDRHASGFFGVKSADCIRLASRH